MRSAFLGLEGSQLGDTRGGMENSSKRKLWEACISRCSHKGHFRRLQSERKERHCSREMDLGVIVNEKGGKTGARSYPGTAPHSFGASGNSSTTPLNNISRKKGSLRRDTKKVGGKGGKTCDPFP